MLTLTLVLTPSCFEVLTTVGVCDDRTTVHHHSAPQYTRSRRELVPSTTSGQLNTYIMGAVDDMLLIGRAPERPSWPVARPQSQPLSLTRADGHRPPQLSDSETAGLVWVT